MRADNDLAVGNSVESVKDESKPHQCSEEKWEEDGKNNNNNNVCELFYDTRSGNEWLKENDGNTLERHSCDSTAKRDSVDEVDPVYYMDKNVMACDLPEIVVCYKENTYHVVKDICVDEGVPVQEKFLFGEKDSVKSSSDDLMKAVNPFETKSLEEGNSKVDESDCCTDCKTDQNVDESPKEVFADAEGSSNVNEEVNDSKASHEIECEEDSKDEVTISSEELLKEFLTLGDILSREDEEKPLLDDSLRHEEHSQPQLQDNEKRSVETTFQEPNNDSEKQETENQQKNYLVVDESLVSSRFGETSFSAADAVSISGHITYSGPIAFSGSLSVRSDASTTSGRSFAFPILQSEWNSSPVRMAKADKRRQKGWRHSFLCCRFS